MANNWARSLHYACRLGHPQCFSAGRKITRGPHTGQGGYITSAALGGPKRVAGGQNGKWTTPTWATWLYNSCPLGGSHTFTGGAESEVAHSWACWLHNPCPLGSPPLQSAGQNQKWPTGWQHNPCPLEVPGASERGAESQVAHTSARWLHNTCCLPDPHRFKTGGRIRSG